MTWDTIFVGTALVVGAAGCLCLGYGWLGRHDRQWQDALSKLARPEARVRVFGEWNNIGEDRD